ncbi:MAG: hypothetical protein IPK52_16030 [Chloroflexi bacterium]|nr:hypothetical protein [Chloroflexota bacterium]
MKVADQRDSALVAQAVIHQHDVEGLRIHQFERFLCITGVAELDIAHQGTQLMPDQDILGFGVVNNKEMYQGKDSRAYTYNTRLALDKS